MNIYRTMQTTHSKGQIIVIMALVFVGLIAIIGLAVDLGYVFVSYSRLRKSVDAAALAATGQFRQGYSISNLQKEAQQFLDLNGVTDTTNVSIESCETTPSDAELCTTPPRKLVRVTVTQTVPLYFLGVVGLHTIPITVSSLSEAASVDLVLLIDRSTSMALDSGGHDMDPKVCNPSVSGPGTCHPFVEIKTAANLLVDQMFLSPDGTTPGYDRVSVVTLDRYPTVALPMTDNKAVIQSTVTNLTVYEGVGKCPWPSDYPGGPLAWQAANAGVTPAEGPCRLYSSALGNGLDNAGAFQRFDCSSWSLGSPKDPRGCMVTNSGGGLKVAGNVLGGSYPAGTPNILLGTRTSALWVVVWLTDGFSNIGFQNDGVSYPQSSTNAQAICPNYTWTRSRLCIDENANPTVDDLMGIATPPATAADLAARHVKTDLTYYDPDDYARDMIDFVTDPSAGQGALLFTIGLGTKITERDANEIAANYPPTGETLLKYGAYKGGGIYYAAPSASQLNAIFLAIADKIATRISR